MYRHEFVTVNGGIIWDSLTQTCTDFIDRPSKRERMLFAHIRKDLRTSPLQNLLEMYSLFSVDFFFGFNISRYRRHYFSSVVYIMFCVRTKVNIICTWFSSFLNWCLITMQSIVTDYYVNNDDVKDCFCGCLNLLKTLKKRTKFDLFTCQYRL